MSYIEIIKNNVKDLINILNDNNIPKWKFYIIYFGALLFGLIYDISIILLFLKLPLDVFKFILFILITIDLLMFIKHSKNKPEKIQLYVPDLIIKIFVLYYPSIYAVGLYVLYGIIYKIISSVILITEIEKFYKHKQRR